MTPSTALSVVSAVVTPALLILACSSLITATAGRLSRLLERVRGLTEEVETLGAPDDKAVRTKRDFIVSQLLKAAARAKLLQRAMLSLYFSLGALVLTSVAIGLNSAYGLVRVSLLNGPVLVSVVFLLYASVLLIRESRIALSAVDAEMEYVRRLIGP